MAPPEQLSSGALVAVYGSWKTVCRSAYGLRPDGRCVGPGRPWITRSKVRSARHRWTPEDCLNWLRRCALDLGRRPTSADYDAWRRELVRIPGQQGLRAPWANTIAQRCGNGSWLDIAELLPVTDSELNEVRAKRLPNVTPAELPASERIAYLSEGDLRKLGLTATHARKLRGLTARRALPLSRAIRIAGHLGGSLDWLAGRAEARGNADEETCSFSPERLTTERHRLKLTETRLREAAGITLGPWRSLMSGKSEPTLGQLASLAAILAVPLDDLVD